MLRLREKLRYRFDNFFMRGWLAQFLLLVFFSVAVILVGTLTRYAGLFSPENAEVEGIARTIDNGGKWDTLWWSMKHIFDPAFFDMDYGATWPVALMALMLSIFGMAIFGILIGFISTAIEERVEALKKGNSPVQENHHVLILGWSEKLFAILRLLANYQRRLVVVVLAPVEIEEMQEALRLETINELPLRLVLRNGNPSHPEELRRVAYDRARSIIVLSNQDGKDAMPDIGAIKVVSLLAACREWVHGWPKIVCEVQRHENVEVAETAGKDLIPIVSGSRTISRVLVQSALQSKLSVVYSEIFSYYGNEIYILNYPDCGGKRFGDVAWTFKNAVLLGLSQAVNENGNPRFIPVLNPGADYIIGEQEWLIMLMRDKASVKHDLSMAAHQSAIAHIKPYVPKRMERFLILGWNPTIYEILAELDSYAEPETRIDILACYSQEEADERLRENIVDPFMNIGIEYRKYNTISKSMLEKLDIAAYNCLMLLADESQVDDPDSRTIMSLILLRSVLEQYPENKRPRVVTEIINPSNRELVESHLVKDVIVSPAIVSMQLAQISQQQMLHTVYEDLLNVGGNEIYLKPASRYVQMGVSCSFDDLIAAAQMAGEIACGVALAEFENDPDKNYGIQLVPPNDATWVFGPQDRIVVLAETLYDIRPAMRAKIIESTLPDSIAKP